MSLVLNIAPTDLEKVVYYTGYLVTSVDENKRKEILESIDKEYKKKVESVEDEETIEKLKKLFKEVKNNLNSIVVGSVLDELQHQSFSGKFKDLYTTEIGAEAIYKMMLEVDLKKLQKSLEKELENSPAVKKDRLRKRLALIKSMNQSNMRPE